jgi:hypothetical protein
MYSKNEQLNKANDEEEKKNMQEIDDSDEDTLYICIRSIEFWINENNVEVHNEIVRVLRKQPIEHYSLY